MFFSKLAGQIFFFCTLILCSSTTENTDVIEFCNELRSNRKLLLVSTLDGQLTALSLDKGEKQWSVATEPGPLLSSTIHHLELSENSQLVRIIPSLNGGLYKFDGESIEPMPVNTDSLLKSYWDDVDISGGKEVRSYAIDIESGNVFYECSMNECSNWTENAYLHTDMIILRRETQKVRAIELQSRAERWNYSVGLHNITVSHNPIPECNLNSGKSTEFYIRAIVPKGVLFVSRRTSPDENLWEYEFGSPIVNAWTLVGSHLEWIDLFKPLENSSRKDKPVQPALYIGIHDDQLYIQESEPLHKNQLLLGRARFSMKKYRLIHALDFENKQDVVPLITDESERNSTTALAMLYGSELVKGEGYYLYCAEGNGDCQNRRGRVSTFFSSIFSLLCSCWKEISILIMVTCYVIHCVMPRPNWPIAVIESIKTKYDKLRRSRRPTESVEILSSGRDSGISGIVCQTEYEIKDFKSRYLEDFEPIHCLGRGGFGVVFQARNKIDDCHYAIKRITLPNKEEARERVMREVKALAKLEHTHIVRYFQAWQECPPSGWQEEQDKLWKNKTKDEYLSSEADCLSEISITSSPSRFSRRSKLNSGINVASKSDEDLSDSFIVFDAQYNNSCSELPNQYDSTTTVEKSSYSAQRLGAASNRKLASRTSKVYLYIQMQLCQKNSLREWLCDNLERDHLAILHMFNQIVQAVEYVHLQGLIHRDLKPSNIFFSPDGQIKVGDFGLVTEIVEDHDLIIEQKKQSVSNGTHTANVGTELYMSPEQVLGKQYTYKVDIYSLGIILFELLTPFSTQMERYHALTDLRNSKFPQDFHVKHQSEYELLQLMLSRDPEKRPTTFGIRSRSPFNNFHPSEPTSSLEWHFELPAKSSTSTNILRKSSNENV